MRTTDKKLPTINFHSSNGPSGWLSNNSKQSLRQSFDISEKHFDIVKFKKESWNLNKFISSNWLNLKNQWTKKETLKSTGKMKRTNSIGAFYIHSKDIKPVKSSIQKLNGDPSEDMKKEIYYRQINAFLEEKEERNEIFENDSSWNSTLNSIKSITENNGYIFRNRWSMSSSTPNIADLSRECNVKLINRVKNMKNRVHYQEEEYKQERRADIVSWKDIYGKTVKWSFKHEDEFIDMLMNNYIKKQNIKSVDDKHRTLFIVIEGTWWFNENVKGVFIDIPKRAELKKKPNRERVKILMMIWEKCTKWFNYPRFLKYVFTKNLEVIFDLVDIKEKDQYIILSSHISAQKVKIISSLTFINLYKTQFKEYLNSRDSNNKDTTLSLGADLPFTKHFKTKPKITHRPRWKHNNSFTNIDEYDNKYDEEYVYYSDNEDNLKQYRDWIFENCYTKNDFFLYLNEKESNDKIEQWKSKWIHTKPINIEKLFNEFKCDHDDMIKRLNKETGWNPIKNNDFIKKDLQVSEWLSNIEVHNMQAPKNQFQKVFIPRKDSLPYVTLNKKPKTFYHNIIFNVNKYYPHFLNFNVKKFHSLYRNFERRNWYQIFVIYKNWLSLCYGWNKNDIVLWKGIDFATFWKGTYELSVEKSKFVEKLYAQINKSRSGLLSINDYFGGMSFIQNNDLKEKLDLFLKALDASGKGVLNYDEVLTVCKESIKRNLGESGENCSYALVEWSDFFAKFIFKLWNVDLKRELELSLIKKAIIQGSIETQYLEMFCGTNKVS